MGGIENTLTGGLLGGAADTFNPLAPRGAGIGQEDLTQFSQSSYSSGVDLQLLAGPQGGMYSQGLAKFNQYIQARDAQKKQHAEYVAAVQDRPGRQATILTADQPKTVLG